MLGFNNMYKRIVFIGILISATQAFAQNKECGYKEECLCDTTNTTVLQSYKNSGFIIHASVIKIDTLSIKEIITEESISQINNDTLSRSECAKKVLFHEKVIRVKVRIKETFKGKPAAKEIFIITPYTKESCSYRDFNINKNLIIYGTQNENADIYFLWTFDRDYFKLKPEYTIWTNKCKRTMPAQGKELRELREIQMTLSK